MTLYKTTAKFFILIAILILCTASKKNKPVEKPKHIAGLLKEVAPFLVNKKGEKLEKSDIQNIDYVLYYWSAHWCGPCKKFTPKLVELYKNNGGGEKFEVVFVSSDRSKDKMLNYMQKANMEWPAIEYGQKKNTSIRKFGSGYIPHLMLTNKNGDIIGMGRGMLDELKKRLSTSKENAKDKKIKKDLGDF